MNRIRVIPHEEFTRRFPGELVSEIEVTTRTGGRFVERAEFPKGHARNPMTEADVVTKFHALADDALSPARAGAALDALWKVDEAPNIGPALDLFTISR